ncbi:MAG: NAD(P)-dependent glycerol-3-phosphate dehydrogenase [Fibrobacterales bacterium]
MIFTVLGTGSWGLTIGKLLSENGHEVRFWTYSAEEAAELTEKREHVVRLPGIKIPDSCIISTDLQEMIAGTDTIVFAVPSIHVRSVAAQVNGCTIPAHTLYLSLIKGIEKESFMRVSEIIISQIDKATPENVLVLSGPSHAEEVARHMPTAVVIAGQYLTQAEILQKAFSNEYFRVYQSDDVMGVELCGSLKNVIAIATGILDGMGFGDNPKGALITRGLAEISRLGERMGGQLRTFSGLAGMGDLITTCTSSHSRNRHVGEHIGLGKSIDDILSEMTMVAEGVPATLSTWQMSKKYDIDMPISNAVYEILYNGKDPKEAIKDLMRRELKAEGI